MSRQAPTTRPTRRLMRMQALAFGLAILLSGADDAPKADPSAADLKAMQGEWFAVEFDDEGNERPIEQSTSFVTITKDVLDEAPEGGTLSVLYPTTWTITLDASKSPKEVDFRIYGNPKSTAFKGIYSLEGDTLKYYRASANQPRPKEFKAPAGTPRPMVLKRKKSGAK